MNVRKEHAENDGVFYEDADNNRGSTFVMPSAPDELRALMMEWFGSIDATPVENFLRSRGWELTHEWTWHPPVTDYSGTQIEWLCMSFLVYEWDYGGFDMSYVHDYTTKYRPMSQRLS